MAEVLQQPVDTGSSSSSRQAVASAQREGEYPCPVNAEHWHGILLTCRV